MYRPRVARESPATSSCTDTPRKWSLLIRLQSEDILKGIILYGLTGFKVILSEMFPRKHIYSRVSHLCENRPRQLSHYRGP